MNGQAVHPAMATSDFKALLNSCIHCGLCLQACPTYIIFGTEMDSPRGRIMMMRAVSEGRLGLENFSDAFAKHINLCLSCLACQPPDRRPRRGAVDGNGPRPGAELWPQATPVSRQSSR